MNRIILLLMLLSIFGLDAKVITFDNNWAKNPLFNLVSETPFRVDIVFSMHKLVIEEMEIDGVPMRSYGVPGIFLFNDEGAPNLAGTGRYIAIPQGAKAKVTILGSRTEVYHNIELAPAPNIPFETDDSPLRYAKNMKIYGRNAYYPDEPVKLSKPMKMRGVDVVILGITPFQYNPVTKDLIVYKDLRMRVNFIGGNGHFGENRLRSRFWELILQGNLLNYKSLPKIDFYNRSKNRYGFEYIIIVPDDPIFEAWADTIKFWRKLQGISSEVFTLTEVGGNAPEEIKNFLQNAYNTWNPAPVAFLLLSDYPSSGDMYGITSKSFPHPYQGTYVSDNWYADFDNDTLPELHHGRICAQTETQLSLMINKFLSYERSPYTASNFYDEPLIACAWQTPRWFQLCGEVIRGFFINSLGKNPARQYAIYQSTPTPGCAWSTAPNTATVVNYFSNLGYIPTTNQHGVSWWSNGSASGINAAINSGAFLVQHRDHGATWGWGHPHYSTADLDGLTNTMFPFVYSTNCLTGEYNSSSECFTEKFHRITHGALGVNAASQISYSFVNDTYVWGTYDCLWQQFMPDYPTLDMTGYDNLRPCQAMTYGKYFLQASSWPYNSSAKHVTYGLFHHHGDAFITLYSEIPQELNVTHAPILQTGQTYFTVAVNDSSLIALTVNGEIIGIAEGTGSPVNITIPGQSDGDTMLVTVTEANYYRYTREVPVGTFGAYIGYLKYLINDSGGNGQVNPNETIIMPTWVKNFGAQTAYNVSGDLTENDPYVNITTGNASFGTITPNDSALSTPDFIFDVSQDCPNGHKINFTLTCYSSSGDTWPSNFSVTAYASVLIYQKHKVVGGNDNGILDPGETANIVLTIKNRGGQTAENVSSILQSLSPYVTVNDSSGNFGSIAPGDTANNAADPYTITASLSTPQPGITPCEFRVIVASGIYLDTLTFSLIIGRKHYFIWNPDPTPSSGEVIHSFLSTLGYTTADYDTILAADLISYSAVFVCVGVSPHNYVIADTSAEASALVDYLQNHYGRMYLEGADVWWYDPQYENGYDFGPLFGINPVDDGNNDMGPMSGQAGTFTEGMNFSYGGENEYMDHIDPTGTGFPIFHDTDNNYNCGIANDAGTYQTVGTSFELGGLIDATPPSTRAVLLDSIMHFFGIYQPIIGIAEEIQALKVGGSMFRVYPNPAKGRLLIEYSSLLQEKVPALKIYDVTGRIVRNLALTTTSQYSNSIEWNAKDDKGRRVPAGIYFVRFETGNYKKVEKVVLLH